MHVSDEAKLFAVRERLLQAERTIYEANKILANVGEPSRDGDTWACSIPDSTKHYISSDPNECVE